MNKEWQSQWLNSREVAERVYVTGRLVLETPAHFGNGDTDAVTDIPLLRDSLERTLPLLTGASIAGALRNYLREYEVGYGEKERNNGVLLAEQLFGHLREETRHAGPAAVESWLMVDDALGELPQVGQPVEIRDGVAIDMATRTAEINDRGKGFKYDIELLAAGTSFPLSFELWLPRNNQALLHAFALALRGFETGEIGLGMRKRRGFGHCRVVDWRVWRYSMETKEGVIGWLTHDPKSSQHWGTNIVNLLDANNQASHAGQSFVIDATFRLRDSLLIRSDNGLPDAPDMVHLRSGRPGEKEPVPILSGTSLAGAVRGRAYRIANTMKGADNARNLIDGIFGRRQRPDQDERDEQYEPTGSRLLVRESVIKNRNEDRVQNRVKIDRFTGGAYPQALFSQQPVFAKAAEPTEVSIYLELRKHQYIDEKAFQAEIGLLLLLLKDLWTGDLPLGGESSVGRGRLQGQKATLTIRANGEAKQWILQQVEGEKRLLFGGNGNNSELEDVYLKAFLEAAP